MFFVSVASKRVSVAVSDLESTLTGFLQVLILRKLSCARIVRLRGRATRVYPEDIATEKYEIARGAHGARTAL
jgi:hypothetical protein